MHFKELKLGSIIDMYITYSNKEEIYHRLRLMNNLGDSIETIPFNDKMLSPIDLCGVISIYLLYFSKEDNHYYLFKNPKIDIKENMYVLNMNKEGIIFSNQDKERYYGTIDCCYDNYNPCLFNKKNVKEEDIIIIKNISKKDCYIETNKKIEKNENIKFYIVDKQNDFIYMVVGKIKRIEDLTFKVKNVHNLHYGYGIVFNEKNTFFNAYINKLLTLT